MALYLPCHKNIETATNDEWTNEKIVKVDVQGTFLFEEG